MKKSRRTNGLAPPQMRAQGTNFANNLENDTGPPEGLLTSMGDIDKDIGTAAGQTR